MQQHMLTGKKQICNFVGRSWSTIEEWIFKLGFPAKKINGIWESDSELITLWRRKQITGGGEKEHWRGQGPEGCRRRIVME